MAITNRKFTDPAGWDNPSSSFYGKGNYGQPDRPGLTTDAMQKVMDEIPRTMIAPAINGLIDDLSSTDDGASGADNIGATPITGGTANSVQGILEELAMGGVETGVTPGTYGGTNSTASSPYATYPVLTVDKYGRITYAYGQSISLFNVFVWTIAAGNTTATVTVCGQYPHVQCRKQTNVGMGTRYEYLKDSEYTVTFEPGTGSLGYVTVTLTSSMSDDVQIIVMGNIVAQTM